jgi:hypothetical protein
MDDFFAVSLDRLWVSFTSSVWQSMQLELATADCKCMAEIRTDDKNNKSNSFMGFIILSGIITFFSFKCNLIL